MLLKKRNTGGFSKCLSLFGRKGGLGSCVGGVSPQGSFLLRVSTLGEKLGVPRVYEVTRGIDFIGIKSTSGRHDLTPEVVSPPMRESPIWDHVMEVHGSGALGFDPIT